MTAESPAPVPQGRGPLGLGPLGLGPLGLGPLGLGPLGQVRIYQGAQHRFIWPVHLAGWLELGWTTEPMVTPVATPRVTPTVPSAPRKKRASSTEVNPIGDNPIGVNPVGVGSATADEPLPVLVTDFLVDPSVPTDA